MTLQQQDTKVILLLQLLLRPQIIAMATLLFPAVHSTRMQTSIAPVDKNQVSALLIAALLLLFWGISQATKTGETLGHWMKHLGRENAVIIMAGGRTVKRSKKNSWITYFLQIILSQLYFCAKIRKLGSITPPRRRNTRWRVDSGEEAFMRGAKADLHGTTLTFNYCLQLGDVCSHCTTQNSA